MSTIQLFIKYINTATVAGLFYGRITENCSFYGHRHSITKAFCIAFLLTFFSIFDVPVFWPILLFYWLVLFALTMRRQIMHMMKYKYVPFNFGKQVTNLISLLHIIIDTESLIFQFQSITVASSSFIMRIIIISSLFSVMTQRRNHQLKLQVFFLQFKHYM